jgi:hypothetical protein
MQGTVWVREQPQTLLSWKLKSSETEKKIIQVLKIAKFYFESLYEEN